MLIEQFTMGYIQSKAQMFYVDNTQYLPQLMPYIDFQIILVPLFAKIGIN